MQQSDGTEENDSFSDEGMIFDDIFVDTHEYFICFDKIPLLPRLSCFRLIFVVCSQQRSEIIEVGLTMLTMLTGAVLVSIIGCVGENEAALKEVLWRCPILTSQRLTSTSRLRVHDRSFDPLSPHTLLHSNALYWSSEVYNAGNLVG